MNDLQLLLAQVDTIDREMQMARRRNYAMLLHLYQAKVKHFDEELDIEMIESVDPGCSEFLHHVEFFPQ